jgi:hypothetical protein
MNKTEARKIKVGDLLVPDPCWNKTGSRKLSDPTVVLAVNREAQSQTGTMVRVEFTDGTDAWLDAGWFLGWSDKP